MKYNVSGVVNGRSRFSIVIEAGSEKLASLRAKEKIGSTQGIKASQISIDEAKKVE